MPKAETDKSVNISPLGRVNVDVSTDNGLQALNKKANAPLSMQLKAFGRDYKLSNHEFEKKVRYSSTTLLNEVLYAMKAHKITPEDVLWVGNKSGTMVMSWQHFARLAKKRYFLYTLTKTYSHVPHDLVLVGQNFVIQRNFDSESWSWRVTKIPQKRSNFLSVDAEINVLDLEAYAGCRTLAAINKNNPQRFIYADASQYIGGLDPNIRNKRMKRRLIGGKRPL